MRQLVAPLILFSLVFFWQCAADQLPEPSTGDCENVEVSYQEDVRPIIESSCAYSGCHLANPPGDYSDYEGLRTVLESGEFTNRVFTLQDDEIVGMPPNYAPSGRPTDLSQEELNVLRCWVEDGFPEN